MSGKQVRQSASKQQKMREERLKRERQKRIRLIMIIAGVVIVLIVAVIVIRNLAQPSASDIKIIASTPRPQVNFNSMGDPNAPVKIVEYSDFQCPYCKLFADETENQIVEHFVKSGKVYFTFRSMGNFISDNIGQGSTESRDAAMAVYCAADQGKFWEYKDSLYANWLGEDVGSFTRKRLEAMAESIGLGMVEFNQCMESNKYRARVDQDNEDGLAAGITGTPSFLINGKILEGAQPLSAFQQEIESAIQSSGN